MIIELEKLGFTLDEKQLSMTVVPNKTTGTSAAACPEVIEFYQRALLGQTEADNFKNVPFNKSKKRIPRITTGNVLKSWNCSFSDGVTANLSTKEVEVSKVSVMMEICIADLEDSFLIDRMTAGQNNPVNPQDFLNYLWGYIGDQAGEDLETLRWLGDTENGADAFHKLTNGYVTQLELDRNEDLSTEGARLATHIVSAGSISDSNVIGELYKLIKAVPKRFRKATGRNELKIFVSSDIALAFQIATSQGTAVGSYVTNTGDMFIGRYKLIEVPTLPEKTIIASPKEDIIYTYDLLNDKNNFTVVDMLKTAAEPKVRFRVNMAIGFAFDTLQNVVYYSPTALVDNGGEEPGGGEPGGGEPGGGEPGGGEPE